MAMKPRAMNKKKTESKTKMMRGGMTKSNAGASMKPGQKSTPKATMMRGGVASKVGKANGGMTKKSGSAKMMRGGMTKKKK